MGEEGVGAADGVDGEDGGDDADGHEDEGLDEVAGDDGRGSAEEGHEDDDGAGDDDGEFHRLEDPATRGTWMTGMSKAAATKTAEALEPDAGIEQAEGIWIQVKNCSYTRQPADDLHRGDGASGGTRARTRSS